MDQQLQEMFDIPTDPAMVGLDAGIVLATSEVTNLIKEALDGWGLGEKLARLYPFIPFFAAGIFCLLMEPSLKGALLCAAKYGIGANFAFRAYKVTLKGE